MVRTDFCNKVFFLRLVMLEGEKMTECLCLALKLASWSGIYRSSVRKRGANDGIVEISNRSNFLRERERERERYEFCGGQKIGKIVF